MKDEIKEILEDIKDMNNYSNFIDSQYGGKNYYYLLEKEESKKLSDYITNLQTIEQQYSAILSENAELENKITNLQEENEEQRNIIVKQNNSIKEAIEYIEQWRDIKTKRIDSRLKGTLNILQGEDKDDTNSR